MGRIPIADLHPDRWCTVGTDGVHVPLKLSHRALGHLVDAQRPARAGRHVDAARRPPEALARLRGSAKERPTVSTPITWDEVETRDPQSLVFEIDDVLERVAEHGDLFAAVLTKRQRLSTS